MSLTMIVNKDVMLYLCMYVKTIQKTRASGMLAYVAHAALEGLGTECIYLQSP
jgi:hypothetical protein